MTSAIILQLDWMAKQGGSDIETASTQSTRRPMHRGRDSFRAAVALLTEETTHVYLGGFVRDVSCETWVSICPICTAPFAGRNVSHLPIEDAQEDGEITLPTNKTGLPISNADHRSRLLHS